MSIFMSMTVSIGHNHEHEHDHDHNHVHGIHLWYGRVEHVHLMAIVNPIREASDHQVLPKFLNHENNISLDHILYVIYGDLGKLGSFINYRKVITRSSPIHRAPSCYHLSVIITVKAFSGDGCTMYHDLY